METGEDVIPQQGEPTRMIVGHQMRFPFANGFPIITERDMVSAGTTGHSMFERAIAELVAFLNGAQSQQELEAFGCDWWKAWVTPEKCAKRGLPAGDLGPGSYGAAWRRFPTAEGAEFDQWAEVIEEAHANPHLRTLFVSPWVPQYIPRRKGRVQKVVVAPCHGWVHILINEPEDTLTLHHIQRSGDVPVGVAFNIIQYAALTLMVAHVLGYTPVECVYTISDAHIYMGSDLQDRSKSQVPDVTKMLSTSPKCFPTVELVDPPDSLFDFRPHHFAVSDYNPSLGRMRIWTPV